MRSVFIFLLVPMCFHMAAQDDMLAGLSALKNQDAASAETAFDEVVDREPNNAKAWYYRAVSRMVQGDHTGALQDLDHLLDMEPTDAHALLRRAEARAVIGDPVGARSDLYKVIGIHANGPAAEHALFELGRLAIDANDLPAAMDLYDRLVGIAPYNAMAWCDRGIVLAAMGASDRAIADLERAIDLDPTLERAYARLGHVLLEQGRRQEGCHALRLAHDQGDRSVEETLLIHCDH